MQWYLDVLRNFADFSGRARRKEYWMFFLINLLISFALAIVDIAFGMFSDSAGIGLLGGIYGLAVLIPSLAVSVRRLHDVGYSGWWLLIGLVPILGAIALLVLLVLDSKVETNAYGRSPKYAEL